MFRIISNLALTVCLVLSFNTKVYSNTYIEHIEYLTEDFHPFNYEQNGQLSGMSVDLLHMLWEEMQVEKQTIKLYPWARGYYEIQNKQNVALFTTSRTAEREDMFKWVGPIASPGKLILIAAKSNPLKLNDLNDAKDYVIETVREDACAQILASKGFKNIKLKTNLNNSIVKLLANHIDLIAYPEDTFFRLVDNRGYDKKDFVVAGEISKTTYYYAFSKNIPDKIIDKFKTAFVKVKQRPSYSELLKKYNLN